MAVPVAMSQPPPSVIATGDDGLAVGTERCILHWTRVRKDRFEPVVVRQPGGQVGACDMLPGQVTGSNRGPPALESPEQALADLTSVKGCPPGLEGLLSKALSAGHAVPISSAPSFFSLILALPDASSFGFPGLLRTLLTANIPTVAGTAATTAAVAIPARFRRQASEADTTTKGGRP